MIVVKRELCAGFKEFVVGQRLGLTTTLSDTEEFRKPNPLWLRFSSLF